MSNKLVSAGLSLSYIGASGQTVTEPSKSVTPSYQGAEPGQILDVPSGATSGTTYSVAFGTIGTEATFLRVDNNCSCPITVRLNGATSGGVPVAAGGFFETGGPTSASGATGGVLTAAQCVLGGTQGWVGGTQTTLPGGISAWVFGDPI